jgi:hypothetical protein
LDHSDLKPKLAWKIWEPVYRIGGENREMEPATYLRIQ